MQNKIEQLPEGIEKVLSAFGLSEVEDWYPLQVGHINSTYVLKIAGSRYILQNLNTQVFTRGHEVMQNIIAVTHYLQEKIAERGGDSNRETLTLIKTVDGADYYTKTPHEIWRCYYFIEDTACYVAADSVDRIREAARCFGQFHADLKGFPMEELYETIVDFHNTEERFRQFESALKADPLKRSATCQPEIDFILKRRQDASYLLDLERQGLIPRRVTHNDTKLSNVLFDVTSDRAMTVIDLDTLMPGLLAFDFGDIVRSGATYAKEDEQDLEKVNFEPELYQAIYNGFVEGMADGISEAEKQSLPWGARLITFECGMRFLTDYLQGDTYFNIERAGQNLDRARTQFKLVADMEEYFA